MPTLTTFIQIVLEVLATAVRQKKGEKEKINKKASKLKEVKLSLSADNMTLYAENSKNFTQNLLNLMNKFSKIAGYKINIQKLVVFLHTNNEILEKKY